MGVDGGPRGDAMVYSTPVHHVSALIDLLVDYQVRG